MKVYLEAMKDTVESLDRSIESMEKTIAEYANEGKDPMWLVLRQQEIKDIREKLDDHIVHAIPRNYYEDECYAGSRR